MTDERIRKVNVLKLIYEAQVESAKVDIDNYLDNSVGVAEHPNLMDSLDDLVTKLSTIEDKLICLKKNF
tara:strand:+ start:330 stop:536 length:207 start_codon:yes stop_codon:yes gene_type:complete